MLGMWGAAAKPLVIVQNRAGGITEVLAQPERFGRGHHAVREIGRRIGRQRDPEIAIADHVPEDTKFELRGASVGGQRPGVVTAAVKTVGLGIRRDR